MTAGEKLQAALAVVVAARAVRKLQKQYFKTREAAALRECKDAERRLDLALAKFGAPPGLFGMDEQEGE